MLKHSGIREAGVVGLPNVSAGELPLAFVVLQPGVQLTEKEIQDYVAERVSSDLTLSFPFPKFSVGLVFIVFYKLVPCYQFFF